MVAYSVSGYEIDGPAWIRGELYDVVAKLPPNTTPADYRLMLQNLLADRFGLAVHREKRVMPGYTLETAKGGPRLRPTDLRANGYASAGNVGPHAKLMQTDSKGLLELRPGRKAQSRFSLPGGLIRVSGRMQSAADITTMCKQETRRPVEDGTRLAGIYDFNLDFQPLVSAPSATADPLGPSGREGTPDEPTAAKEGRPPDFLAAMQEQLGLRLRAQKVSAAMLVIDHANRAPAGN